MGHNSESYTAHQFLFSAQSDNVASAPDYHKDSGYCGALYLGCAYTPWGCDSPAGTTTSLLDPQGMVKPDGPFPCFKYPSLANRVDEAGLKWRLYAHSLCANINGLDANSSISMTSLWPKSRSGCLAATSGLRSKPFSQLGSTPRTFARRRPHSSPTSAIVTGLQTSPGSYPVSSRRTIPACRQAIAGRGGSRTS